MEGAKVEVLRSRPISDIITLSLVASSTHLHRVGLEKFGLDYVVIN